MTPKPRVNLKDDAPPSEGDAKPPKVRHTVERLEATPSIEIDADGEIQAVDFSDADDEFGSDVHEEGEVRGLIRELTGSKGISGATDLTPAQAVLLTQWRVLMHNYPDSTYGLGLKVFPEWFETYRLSINRGSRKENTEILRGNVALKPPPTDQPPGSRW